MNPYQQAIDAGYSDQEIAEYLSQDKPENLKQAVSSGYSYGDVAKYLSGIDVEVPQQEEVPERSWGDAVTDTGKSLMSGVYSGVGDAIGYGIEATGEKLGSKGMADYGGEMRRIQQAEGKKWSESISPEGQEMINTPLFDGWKPRIGDDFLASVVMKSAQSLPGMVAMMPAGGAISRGVTTFGKAVLPEIASALVSGAASPVGKNLLNAVKTQGLYRALADRALSLIPSAVGYGAAEGGIAGLQNAAQTRSEIEDKDQNELFEKSPTYQEYVDRFNGDKDAAQKELAKDAAGDVALKTLLSTGGIGILTGGGVVGMVSRAEKKAAEGIVKTALKGAGEEALQETPQSGAETYIQNVATRDYVDPNKDPMEGVKEASLEGGAVGGFTGGLLGGGARAARNISEIGTPKTPSMLDSAQEVNARLAGIPEDKIQAAYKEKSAQPIYENILKDISDLETADTQAKSNAMLGQAKQANEDILTPGVDPQPDIQTEDPVAIEQRKQREIIGLQTRLANINKKENLTEKDKERLVTFKDRLNTLLDVTPTVEGAFAVPVNEGVDEQAIQEAGLNKEFDTEFQKRGEAQKAQATIKADIQKQRELNVDKAESTVEYKQRDENQKKINALSEHGETLNNLGYEESDLLEMDRKTIANIAKRSMPKGVSNTRPKGNTKPITDIKVARNMAKRLNKKDGGKREAIKFNDTEYGWVDRTTPEGKAVPDILKNIEYQKLSPEKKAVIDQKAQEAEIKSREYHAKREADQAKSDQRKADIDTKMKALSEAGVSTMRQVAESEKNHFNRIEKDYERIIVNKKQSKPVVEKPLVINGKILEETKAKATEPDMTDAFDGTFEQYKEKTKRYYEHYDQALPSEKEMKADYEAGKVANEKTPETPDTDVLVDGADTERGVPDVVDKEAKKEMTAKIDDFFASDKLPGYKKVLKAGKMPDGRVLSETEKAVIQKEIDKIEATKNLDTAAGFDVESETGGPKYGKPTEKDVLSVVRQEKAKRSGKTVESIQEEQRLAEEKREAPPSTPDGKTKEQSESVLVEAKPETDPSRIQEIKNSIAEGEMILKSGKSVTGRKMSKPELVAVQKSVDNAKKKIGEGPLFQKAPATASDFSKITLADISEKDRKALTRIVRKNQSIQNPTDQDIINFLSDAKHDTNLQTNKVKSILKRIGVEDALHPIRERQDSFQRKQRNDARQRFVKILSEWGYGGASNANLSTTAVSKEEATAQKIINSLGVNVVWFDVNDEQLSNASGITFRDHPGVIYLNKKSSSPLISVAFHEFIHTLKRNHPDLYAFLHNSIKNNIVDFDGYIKDNNLTREGVEKIRGKELAYEEFHADFAGDSAMDPKFWQALSKENPTLTQKLAQVISDILDRIKRAFGRYGNRTEGHIENIDKMRDVVAKVISEASKRETVTRTGRGGVKFQTVPLANKWYSAVVKAVDGMDFKKMPAQDLINRFIGVDKSGNRISKIAGVKLAELDWMGFEDWLKNTDFQALHDKQAEDKNIADDKEFNPLGILQGKYKQKSNLGKNPTKADVLTFLQENAVQVEEVVLGGGEPLGFNRLDRVLDEYKEEVEILKKDGRGMWVDINPEEPGVVGFFEEEGDILMLEDLEADPAYSDKVVDAANKIYDGYISGVDESGIRPAKFSQYQIPGGKNYKELLLTLPSPVNETRLQELIQKKRDGSITAIEEKEFQDIDKKVGKDYQSPHWDEPNVLAHVRFSEREVDGKKVLHIEELQSDWHQAGRKKGYKSNLEKRTNWTESDDTLTLEGDGLVVKIDIEKDGKNYYLYTPSGILGKSYSSLADAKKEGELRASSVTKTDAVPDAPWKKTWPIKTFQSMVRYAAENGFDTIAWTPGEIQAERYDLSKQIDGIDVAKRDDGLYNIQITKDGNLVDDRNISAEDMPDYIGKDLAQKIVDNKEVDAGIVTNFSGLDLKVGGEGMKSFYDKILPSVANKFFGKKAWGKAKVGGIRLDGDTIVSDFRVVSGDGSVFLTSHSAEHAQRWIDVNGKVYPNIKFTVESGTKGGIQAHSIPITPEMKSKALREGMPVFEKEKKNLESDTLDILGQDDTIDKELAKNAQKEIDRIKENLLRVGRKASTLTVSEKKTLDLIKKHVEIRRKLKDPNRDLETRIKEFKNYLMTMPENVRAKAMKSFPKLANAKTPETRARYFKQIQKQTQKYLHDYFKRQALKDIHKLRKSGKKTKQGEVKRGGVIGPDAIATLGKLNRVVFAEGVLRGDNKPLRTAEGAEQRISEYNRRITKLKNTQAGAEKKQFDSIQKKIDEIEENKYLVSMFGGYRDMTLDEMQRAYEALDFIITNSKTKWRMQQEMFKAEVGKLMNIVAQDVTGEENPEPEDYIDRKHREESMTAINRMTRKLSQFDTIHQSWRFLMDKISTKGEGKTLRTKTVKEVGGRVHAATNRENQLNGEMSDMMSDKLTELTGLEGRKLSNWVNKNSYKIKDDYEAELPTGTKTLSMTPFQAGYVWSVSKRAEALEVENIHGLRQRLDNQGITREVIRKIEKTVDPKILEMAQWMSGTLGEQVHANVNPVHEAVFGAPLTQSESYVPIKADYGRGSVDESGMLEKGEPKISMVKSAMKELSNTGLGIKTDTNLLDVWIDHIYDMNHFTAWGIPIKEVSAVFSNTEIRNFIKKEHGPHMTASIDQFVEHFKSGTKKRKEMFRGLDRLRANFSTAVLGLNPTIFFKQLGSFNAMAENISTAELITGTNEFFKNPKKAMKIIGKTQFAKTRKRRGHTRDVAQALSQTAGQTMGQIQGFKNQMMFMTRAGDKVPIYIGGYAVYSTFYKKFKSLGMSEQKAHEEAVKEFEITASETQQSGETMHLGLAQHAQMGAIQKLFTMFMSAQTSYYRHVSAAIRNMKKAPGDSAKRLMIFWVAMPAIFEAIASAPLAFGDDEDKELLLKRMGRSVALGPINGLFIARDISAAIYNQLWLTEEGWMDPQYSPVADVADNVVKLAREIGQGLSDEWDWAETFEPINDLVGELTGLPTIGGKRLLEGWMDDETEHPIARKLGYGTYATNRK